MKKKSPPIKSKYSKSKSHRLKTKTTTKPRSSATGRVRIIGGMYKRRSIDFIDADGLRPTPDRLRETLFNWLLADIHDARVLDSCAGSGVLGFEALSRGAAHATFIEPNLDQHKMLQQSAERLHLEATSYQILQGTAQQVLKQDQLLQNHFDIVFIDPPYAQDLWQPILTALISKSLIDSNTLIYLEADKALEAQLQQLADEIHQQANALEQTKPSRIRFECVKQTKVGQVVAGLYRLTAS
ncbi:16S rRNA (guanine(966)-N(2))-methyltransferase RsmD [Psychrobacter sp. F1192]|uniref:Ribosomal RNA small subunit methyltransferase D n=1 Tax=Psychrobacter coccoides TaxID=2818440 RepID=A0ABS3NQS9_9GAMM|nr:16S rRNA (guanine(966)-N(2))-methyltransferase RsmD [Psychrobacter coccoides]MBO1531772.1 16S rRNA (guanine(966)-N(2))-methyltransferase RsmD [Psychrobacter coccoides]